MPEQRVKFLTILIFFGALALFSYSLGHVKALVWDEQYHVVASQYFLVRNSQAYFNPNNPPLGKILIALSRFLLGDTFFAYRFPSALSGAGVAALLAWFGARCSKSLMGGLLASALWLTSTLAYIHARLAMLDMMTTFFFLASFAAFSMVLQNPLSESEKNEASGKKLLWLYIACFLAAWGGAIKVLCYLLFPLFLLGLVLIRKQWPLRKALPHLIYATLVFSSMALIFSYSFLGASVQDIPQKLKEMYILQSSLHRDHANLSFWYEWFLFQGSHWYGSQALAQGLHIYVWCTNNPILWISGALSLIYLSLCSRNKPLEILVVASVFIQILFWAFFKKQTILYYALPIEPFFCIAIVLTLSELAHRLKKGRAFFLTWSWVLVLASSLFFIKNWSAMQGMTH